MKVTQQRMAALVQHIRNDELMKFYKSREWLALRKEALERDCYECQLCKAAGGYHKAENVHHIKEVKAYPWLALTLHNLQCLCIACHNKVHERLDHVKEPAYMNEERW